MGIFNVYNKIPDSLHLDRIVLNSAKIIQISEVKMREDINSTEFLERITQVVPDKRQIYFQNLGYYNFIHFGLNTFTKKEWGSGKVNPKVFTLTDIDTDKWAKQLKSTGSKGIIITAKHHDGFCLFPSKYTDYTIAAT